MKKNTFKHYEAPKMEVIEIENQGVLCASGGGAQPQNFNGNGFQFNTRDGVWG